MDRIVLGRLLILHIKCFYIGSVIPFRSGMPRRLFCFPCGGRVDRLLCRGPRSCRRRACWRRRNSSWRRWWTRTTSNEEGQKHACFFVALTLSCVCCRVPTSKCMWIFPAYFVSQSRNHFIVFDYGDVAIPQQTLLLGTMFAGGASSAWCCNCQGWGFTSSLEPFVQVQLMISFRESSIFSLASLMDSASISSQLQTLGSRQRQKEKQRPRRKQRLRLWQSQKQELLEVLSKQPWRQIQKQRPRCQLVDHEKPVDGNQKSG